MLTVQDRPGVVSAPPRHRGTARGGPFVTMARSVSRFSVAAAVMLLLVAASVHDGQGANSARGVAAPPPPGFVDVHGVLHVSGRCLPNLTAMYVLDAPTGRAVAEYNIDAGTPTGTGCDVAFDVHGVWLDGSVRFTAARRYSGVFSEAAARTTSLRVVLH